MKNRTFLLHLALLATGLLSARAQTAFTYQGKLTDDCCPATGLYDLNFNLYGNPSGGSHVGNTVSKLAVPVTNGLFSVSLDFGSGAFTGAQRWLQMDVRTNNAALSFVTLMPR